MKRQFGFRRLPLLITLAFSCSLLPALANPDYETPKRFNKPDLQSDEGGLWAIMDREEVKLRRSPFVIKEKRLQEFVQNISCRLTPEHCPDIRVHLVRNQYFNASMAPNGMMQVWSGLMLRVDNEDQLSAVLGHEAGHYLERHSLNKLQDMKSRAALGQFLGVLGIPGLIGALVVVASHFSFSREQESDADRIGLNLMHKAGFDPRESAKIWHNLLEEAKAGPLGDPGKNSPLFASHPAMEDRKVRLEQVASEFAVTPPKKNEEWLQLTAPFVHIWLEDEIKRGSYAESLVLLERLSKRSIQRTEYIWAKAEVFRLRNEGNDIDNAITNYQLAISSGEAPVEAYRGIGLAWRQKGEKNRALEALARYLELSPNCSDAGMVRSYIEELRA